MGGGTKTHAGANVGVRRTEAKKYCPQMNVGGRAAANLADIKSALKVLGGVGDFFKSPPRKTASPYHKLSTKAQML